VALGVVAAAAIAALALRSGSPSEPAPAAPTAGAAAPRVRALTEWPPPKTSSPEAATLYAEALQALRDAATSVFTTKLLHAVELDPHFGAAHVRLALIMASVEGAREHIAAASAARMSLDERDRRLLAFAEAIFRDPSTFDPALRAAVDLAESMPDDPEAQYWAAGPLMGFAPEADVIKLLDRAIRLDPGFAGAEHLRSVLALELGDPDAMLAAAERCLAIAPGAVACLRRRADVRGYRGQCRELEQDARRIIALEPAGPQGYGFLLTALAANGAPWEALREVAAKQQQAPADARLARLHAEQGAATLAVWAGDFVQAEVSLRALQKVQASATDETSHTAEWQLIELYDEMGEAAQAAATGDDYLRRLPAWTHDGHSPGRPGALAAMRRAGRLSDAQASAMREAWLMEWRPSVPARRMNDAWLWFYAGWAETPTEAREALAALPAYTPLPPHGTAPTAWGDEGRVYALAGDAGRAVPLLSKAVASCGETPGNLLPVTIDWIVDHVRDRFLLGQMLEQTSDKGGACAQYSAVLARWGAAAPRSVTADRARARSKALGCR
jgi:serine/threonine-protein kinase